MRHLDLFSGIGGFALAAKWMGWETVRFVEIDKFCQKVLAKNFPNVPIHGDIKTFGGKELRGSVDIITGGFPCQPFSTSGKRQGTEDDRYLWPEMLRVIGEVQPPFIVGENVHGLVNWSGGLVFEQVQTDLENQGYKIAPVILPACSVQAVHRRDRIWFIAYSDEFHKRRNSNEINAEKRGEYAFSGLTGCSVDVANSNDTTTARQQRNSGEILRKSKSNRPYDRYWKRNWIEVATEFCGVVHGVPDRLDRLKGLGNAIVPQVAYEIFKAIESTRLQQIPK